MPFRYCPWGLSHGTSGISGKLFVNMADDTDTAAFVQSLKNDNTVRKTTSDMRLFNRWLRSNNEMRLAEEIPVTELDKCLARFFMTVKKDDESNYEPQSVRSMQSSISRYLTEKCAINIMVDKEFHHSRDVMSAKLKQLKSMGMGAKKRKADPFTAEEVNLLYEKELLGAGNNSLHNYFFVIGVLNSFVLLFGPL